MWYTHAHAQRNEGSTYGTGTSCIGRQGSAHTPSLKGPQRPNMGHLEYQRTVIFGKAWNKLKSLSLKWY